MIYLTNSLKKKHSWAEKKHVFFFGNALPKSNVCAHIKQIKKYSGLMLGYVIKYCKTNQSVVLNYSHLVNTANSGFNCVDITACNLQQLNPGELPIVHIAQTMLV